MTDLDALDLFSEPTTPPTPGGAARRCRRHRWLQHWDDIDRAAFVECARCGAIRDEAKSRAGRNNRARGGRAELDVARAIPGARKMGPLGLPWDVEMPGYLRLQVKKLARWPSLSQAVTWLDAIPPSAAMRGVAVVQAGRKPRRLLLLDLDEFAVWYGDPTKGGTG